LIARIVLVNAPMTIHMYTNQVFWATMHGLQGQGPCHFENILQVENNLQLIVVQNLANVQS
jgi:hypothetical protein